MSERYLNSALPKDKKAKRQKSTRGSKPLSKKGRYDLWSRPQSDAFRWKVAKVLEVRAQIESNGVNSPYDYFCALPRVSWDDPAADERNIALTQLAALFSKDEDMQSPIDREQAAFESFLEAEGRCKVVNDAILSGELTVTDRDVACVFSYAQRKIAQILGTAPLIDDLHPTFGPGAVATCRRKTSARFKLATPPSIGRRALRIASRLREGVALWSEFHGTMNVVKASLEFVPKNYKTNRAITIGPSLTGMYQRAIGKEIKHRLLAAGVDLFEGQNLQRTRAMVASQNNELATIDLTQASDSIAYMLVLELLPLDWIELLDQLRDEEVVYRGRSIQLEKFSSMGNGYTFELETLLFYGIIYGILQHAGVGFRRGDVSLYGDDIIVPASFYPLIAECFLKLGFVVNADKSFVTGRFRESCGGDYVHGIDVRPFFVRDRMTHHKLVCFYNHLMRKPHQDPDEQLRSLILSHLPIKFQNIGPDGYGDGHLVTYSDLAEYAKPCKRHLGYAGWTVKTYVQQPYRCLDGVRKKKRKNHYELQMDWDWLLPAYSAYSRERRSINFDDQNLSFVGRLSRSHQSAFLRHIVADLGLAPLDPLVVRAPKEHRVRGRLTKLYVLGPL